MASASVNLSPEIQTDYYSPEEIARIKRQLDSKNQKICNATIRALKEDYARFDGYMDMLNNKNTPLKVRSNLCFILKKAEQEDLQSSDTKSTNVLGVYDSNAIPKQAKLLRHSTMIKAKKAAEFFKGILSPINAESFGRICHCLILTDTLKDLLAALRDLKHHETRYDLAQSMANFCTGNTRSIQGFVDEGGLERMKELLELSSEKAGNPDIREMAARSLSNVAAKDVLYRDLIVGSGVIEPVAKIMSKLFQENLKPIYREGTRLVYSLLHHTPLPPWEVRQHCFVAISPTLTSCKDTQTIRHCLWTLGKLAGQPEGKTHLLHNPILERLICLLNVKHQSEVDDGSTSLLRIDAARVIGQLASEGAEHVTTLLAPVKSSSKDISEHHLLENLKKMIDVEDSKKRTDEEREMALWVLVNISSNATRNQLQQIADAGILPLLLSFLEIKDSPEEDRSLLRIYAAQIIGHLVRSGAVQVARLLRPELNLLTILNEMLRLEVGYTTDADVRRRARADAVRRTRAHVGRQEVTDAERLVRADAEHEEAVQLVANILAKANTDQRQQIVDAGMLPMIMTSLDAVTSQ